MLCPRSLCLPQLVGDRCGHFGFSAALALCGGDSAAKRAWLRARLLLWTQNRPRRPPPAARPTALRSLARSRRLKRCSTHPPHRARAARAAAAGCLPTPVGARSTPTLQPGTQPAVCVRYAASHARLLQLESAAKHGGGCQSAQSALHRAVLARREAAACRGRAPQLMRWLAGT